MKTKKAKIIIISILILTICYTGCMEFWLGPEEEESEYVGDLYIPDSLKFPHKDGDTVIFTSSKDADLLDTFIIETYSYLHPIFNKDATKQIGNEEVYVLIYKREEAYWFNLKIYYDTEESIWEGIELTHGAVNQQFCETDGNYTTIGDYTIGNKTYHNVIYTEACTVLMFDIYRNMEYGLISYTTIDNETFYFHKHIPINLQTK